MLLGLPFHAALPYSYQVNTVVLSEESSLAAEWLGSMLHSFRMGAFFVVAGYFAAHAITRKGPRAWWSRRWRSLSLPLLTGLAIFIPLLLVVRSVDMAGAGPGAWAYFGSLLATPGPHWTSHLWFLVVLLEFSLLTALTWNWLEPRLGALGDKLALYPSVLIAIFMILAALILRLGVAMSGADQHALTAILDLRRFVEYAPFFALGLTLFLSVPLRQAYARLSWPTTITALVAVCAYALFDYAQIPAAAIAAKAAAGTLTCALLLAISSRYLTGHNAAVEWLVQAAFTIYLFHFPVICLGALWLEGVALAPEAKLVILVVASFVVSCLIHQAISRNAVMLMLFNGRGPAVIR
jgi:glucan biosynthesis protein C